MRLTKAYFLPSSTEYLSTRQRGLLFKMPDEPQPYRLSLWAQFCRVQLRPLRSYRRYPHISAKLQDGDEASLQTDSNIKNINQIFCQIFEILEAHDEQPKSHDETLQTILSVQQSIEDIIGWHSTTHGQNRDPPPILIELLSNCFTFRELLGDDNQVNNDHEVAKDVFISKANFRVVHHILTEDLVDACHIIANNNGGPCHMYNLNPGGSGKNRSDRDKRDADNIYALSGTSNSPGQPAVNAVWICLWCDKVKKHYDLDDAFLDLTTAEHVFELIPGTRVDIRRVDIRTELQSTRLLSKKMFLDSELMRPFVDELCEQHRAKSRTSIINDILSKVKETPTQLSDVDVKAPDTIIATWLHKVGRAKNVEIDSINNAKKALKESIKESTKDSCGKLELDEPSVAEQIVTRLGDKLSEVFKDVLKEYSVTPNQ